MMKPFFFFWLFYFVLAMSGFAQQTQPYSAEGGGYWNNNVSGFFASHASLPFGTLLLVTNLDNDKEVMVQVGGRIPEDPRWIVDISSQAAQALEMGEAGFTPVRIEEMVVNEPVTKVPRMTSASLRSFKQFGQAQIIASTTDLIAGHPSIAIGRQMRITNRATGQQVVVTVRNRIRASKDRVIEISGAVARALGMSGGEGYINVNIETVD
jgi:rare lipoprotein A (peptidoglycan hydrolase)